MKRVLNSHTFAPLLKMFAATVELIRLGDLSSLMDIDKLDEFSETILMKCCRNGMVEAVQLLLDSGVMRNYCIVFCFV